MAVDRTSSMPPASWRKRSRTVTCCQSRSTRPCLASICRLPACRILISSFGPAARCASAIFCSGNSLIQRWFLSISIGRSFRQLTSWRQSQSFSAGAAAMAPRADAPGGVDAMPDPANHPAAAADQGPPTLSAKPRYVLTSLQQRLLSAAVLLPIALLALWAGGRVWAAFVSVFALVMIWEWCAICDIRRDTQIPWPSGRLALPSIIAMATSCLALIPTVMPMPFFPPAWFSVLVGFVLTTACAWPGKGRGGLWLALGLVYIVPTSLAAVAIRAQSGEGLPTEIWIVALVVAADTGA